MKKTALCTAVLAIYAIASPVFADELSDLKAEIAAQKQAAEKQRARLYALEQKLNNVQQQQAAAAAAPAPAPAAAQGTSTTPTPKATASRHRGWPGSAATAGA